MEKGTVVTLKRDKEYPRKINFRTAIRFMRRFDSFMSRVDGDDWQLYAYHESRKGLYKGKPHIYVAGRTFMYVAHVMCVPSNPIATV